MNAVEQWGVHELVLAGPEDGNPFLEIDVTAEFSCEEDVVVAAGFYDGGGTYRVRFMPTRQGTWRYRTSSASAALDGATGAFLCVPPTGNNHGPVGVVDRLRFSYGDGASYRPLGTTCYAWIHQSPALQEATLATLARAPFNKIRMCVFPKHYDFNLSEPERYVFPPLAVGNSDVSFDTTRFDVEFFRTLEARIQALGALGIEADLILFHPYDRWGFANLPADEDERYLRYVVARLSAYRNVWWSLANEYDLVQGKSLERWDRALDLVQECDPYGHLRSIHNHFKFYDHSRSAVTHVSAQHEDLLRVAMWQRRYRKPVVVDEYGYEGNMPHSWGNLSAQAVVHRAWLIVALGGYPTHGETYVGDVIWWSHGGALQGQSPQRLAFLRDVLAEAPAVLEPVPSVPAFMAMLGPREDYLLSDLTGGPAGDAQPRAERVSAPSAFPGLHCPHEYYLFYFGERQPAEFAVDLLEGESYLAEVLDTWAMTITPLEEPVRRGTPVRLPTQPHLALRLCRTAQP